MEELYLPIDSFEIEVVADVNNAGHKTSLTNSMKKLLIGAIPAYLSVSFQMMLSTVDILCIGRLNDANELAAIGMASTVLLLLFHYPVISNLGALDTFVSTSYGKKQYYLCGVYLNRSIVILSVIAVPSV